MKRRDFGNGSGCPVEVTLDLIDGKWKGVILYHLQQGRRHVDGITLQEKGAAKKTAPAFARQDVQNAT